MSKFRTLKTISGREITVKENNYKRTWTIKTDASDYRTYPMSKEEFQSALHWTGNDWQQFLKGSDYYRI